MGFGVEQSNGNFYPLKQFTALKTTDLLVIFIHVHNLTYLSLEVDVCALQNQLPHTVYVASVGGNHEECGAMLHGGERDERYALTVESEPGGDYRGVSFPQTRHMR